MAPSAHRRRARTAADAYGHPAVADFVKAIRAIEPSSVGLLAVERKDASDVIGATEVSWAVLDWAKSSGFERPWTAVWDRNTAFGAT